ncbi:MAG TPA: hypothetical protein VEK39_12905 [Solirubrobacterales bacterium]|nr:hypothetical protein [Solirubrobacterales bacterium]
MNSTERKLERLEQIARLRRAQQRAARDRDIATVRAELERELGETVSQRLAARFLGVSHTALRRWIKAGDLPLVFSASGRQEVPVSGLLDLYERVERGRLHGHRRRHHLEPVLVEGRERAGRVRADEVAPESSGENGHSAADRRALAYHRAVAKRLNRKMIDEALHRVWKWRAEGKLNPRYADEWESILRRPVADVRQAIASDSARARDLRQSSPFAGMLSEPERRRILELTR